MLDIYMWFTLHAHPCSQVVLKYSLEVQATNGTWLNVSRPRAPLFGSLATTGGLTIGQKLIDRFAPGSWQAARFRCLEAIGGPGAMVQLASVGLHKMVPPEPTRVAEIDSHRNDS